MLVEEKDNLSSLIQKIYLRHGGRYVPPYTSEILAKSNDERIAHISLQGLAEEESIGKKDVYCIGKHLHEKTANSR
jgi:hypothetical protein